MEAEGSGVARYIDRDNLLHSYLLKGLLLIDRRLLRESGSWGFFSSVLLAQPPLNSSSYLKCIAQRPQGGLGRSEWPRPRELLAV